jgi:hypothetical protein
MSEHNPPAFPANHFDLADNERGMTLRDYFAAKALVGFLAEPMNDGMRSSAYHINGETVDDLAVGLATASYKMADAMLVARKEQP